MFLTMLAFLIAIAAVGCTIVILIEMFSDEVWKGILGLVFGPYIAYYALFEFDHDYKWPVFLVWVFGGAAATGLRVI